jgi:methionyl-tRNA synthetase
VGKGVLRFHAVYWPAFLLSAGLPLPDAVLVQGYLQVEGAKLSKSRGRPVDPVDVAAGLGAEALRYWLLRAVGRGEDADWSEARTRELRRADLANELGNLLQRTVSMVRAYRGGVVPAPAGGSELPAIADCLASRLHEALVERLDPQAALMAAWELVRAAPTATPTGSNPGGWPGRGRRPRSTAPSAPSPRPSGSWPRRCVRSCPGRRSRSRRNWASGSPMATGPRRSGGAGG